MEEGMGSLSKSVSVHGLSKRNEFVGKNFAARGGGRTLGADRGDAARALSPQFRSYGTVRRIGGIVGRFVFWVYVGVNCSRGFVLIHSGLLCLMHEPNEYHEALDLLGVCFGHGAP